MALINCIECGKEISSRAATCPNCGCPVEAKDFEAVFPSNKDNNEIVRYVDVAKSGNCGRKTICYIPL